MSRAVWKFSTGLGSESIPMPVGAKVLYVEPETQAHGLAVTFWAEVNTEATATEDRSFVIVGTGHAIPDDAIYCGTTQIRDMGLVFHLYEVTS